ncbi:aryl-sulfate sulfotransferase [Mesobacterium pallidum]|uniref:aryl-sulfate sulfotransferase n=1 Tax=Mesobacterium pallidum TaxID=2872037 RepID=UPI001EE27EDB|nr:aryl-sulfate sulfotransferase [Mesobacterium pallidum]
MLDNMNGTFDPEHASAVTLGRRRLGLTALDRAKTAGGYTLYARQTGGGIVDLVDIEGSIAHQWQMPVRPGRDAVLLENGNLGYNGSHATSAALYPAWDLWHGGDFYEATPEGEIVWRHEDIYHHHDAQWLPNGDLLYTVAAELPKHLGQRVCGGDPRKDGADSIFQSDIVKQVNRKGETVWEWKIWDHIDPADLPVHPIFDRRHWPMINGVSETKDGLILMSLRTTSGVIAVEKASGRIVWHAGPEVVAQQHTPVMMESGTVLVFDNGNMRPGSSNPFSRALEFDPKTMETTWDYTDPNAPSFFSPFMGSAQRLWNGNTLICESAFGRLFEVTPKGEIAWEFVIPDFADYPAPLNQFIRGQHNTCFRAHRYAAERVTWL